LGTTVTLTAPDSVAADSGWYVWSEDHPPAGPPPPAVLMRRGYQVGPFAGFGAARDSLAMFRFARRAPGRDTTRTGGAPRAAP
jgi:hypothetical protein